MTVGSRTTPVGSQRTDESGQPGKDHRGSSPRFPTMSNASKYICGFDPGLCAGYAVLKDGRLFKCGLLDEESWEQLEKLPIEFAYCERPVVYRNGKARPKDLITLALNAGELIGRLGVPRLYVEPHDWKRSIDPDVCIQRIVKLLNDEEWAVCSKALEDILESKQHNVMDAVGIALYGVGRKVFV